MASLGCHLDAIQICAVAELVPWKKINFKKEVNVRAVNSHIIAWLGKNEAVRLLEAEAFLWKQWVPSPMAFLIYQYSLLISTWWFQFCLLCNNIKQNCSSIITKVILIYNDWYWGFPFICFSPICGSPECGSFLA